MVDSIAAELRYWLSEQPLIRNFEWRQGHTFGSTPQFLIATTLAYLSLTFLLSKSPPPKPPAAALRLLSTAHNLILLLLSLAMALGCTLSALSQSPTPRWIFCFPPHRTPPRGPVFFWAHVFYLSKILEFLDTLLIILNRDFRRLSFLHVYHHSVVLIMCYLWLYTVQSLLAIALVTNCAVHTLMYGYYLLRGLGIKVTWKRVVTDCQIVQFVFSFGVSGVMLWLHFWGGGCSGIWGWVFNAVFNASLLLLFNNFHVNNYASNKNKNNKDTKRS